MKDPQLAVSRPGRSDLPPERPGSRAWGLSTIVIALVLTGVLFAWDRGDAAQPGSDWSDVSDAVVAAAPPKDFVDDPLRPIVVPPSGPVQVATTTRPNIVVLMLDDVAEMDLRLWQRMPTMKQMFVDHGVRFTDYYGDTPLCCPGRSDFLTGLNTVRNGVTINDARLLDPTPTIATELRHAGYYTFVAGKYLNLTQKLADKTPPGWTHSAIMQDGYFNYRSWVDGVLAYHDDDPNDYQTDVFANYAVQYLRMAPPDRPVFALMTPYAAHAGPQHELPLPDQPIPAPRHVGDPRCAGVPSWDPPSYNEPDVSDKPAYIQARPTMGGLDADGFRLTRVCETLLAADEWLRRVRSELVREKRLANTLFVLTVDNGMDYGEHRVPSKYVPYSTPIPLFFNWKAGLGRAPRTLGNYASNIDLAPTLCAVGGCVMGPYDHATTEGVPPPAHADGVDLLPVLLGHKATLGRQALLESMPCMTNPGQPTPGPGDLNAWYAVRTTSQNPLGLWHYVEYDSGERELYDLANDPDELRNLAGNPAYATQQAELADELVALRGAEAPPCPPVIPSPPPSTSPSPSATPALSLPPPSAAP